MGERIFAIYETNQISSIGLPAITESELIRRLNIICDEMHSPKKSIDILLKGDQKGEVMENLITKRKYAEMFVSMSTDYLLGGITWETYLSNTEIAADCMRQLFSAGSATLAAKEGDMGERRFIICEIDQPAVGQIANYEITESELNKRWKIIRMLIHMHVDDKDLTNALLHGEEEKEE